MASRCLCLTFAFIVGCGPDWSPPSGLGPSFSVQIVPVADLNAAPNVLQLRLEGSEGRSALADFRLFSGALSAYHVGRVAAREIPSTLEAREIPVAVWSEADDIVVSPTRPLELDIHTLATPELGRVLEFTVTERVPVLERLWPPRDASEGVGPSVYCGEIEGVEAGPVSVPPLGVPAQLESGAEALGPLVDRCVMLSLAAKPPTGTLLLPPLTDGVAFDPAPLLYLPAAALESPCVAPEVHLGGPVCAEIVDDRVTLRAFGGPSLLSLSAPEPWAAVVAPGRSAVLRGLTPSSRQVFSGWTLDLGAGMRSFEVEFTMLAPRQHLVIDEVLSDPAGVERTSEWIELTNDGSASTSLLGIVFEDVGGAVALPDVLVAPGERVLLVGDDFEPDPELDLVPSPVTRLVRVGTLGKGGLSNQGELLRLRDASGAVLSRFPAEKSPRAGRSLARRSPDAPDDAPSSFAAHSDPGASPGAPNAVEP